MKIICRRCKKVIGEQAPYQDNSEVKAKCTDCITKDKVVGARFSPSPEVNDGQEITLDSGLKGRLWAVKGKSDEISFWELAVSGKKFFCVDQTRDAFKRYIERSKNADIDVSFLHSMKCKIEDSKGRSKKSVPDEEKNKWRDATQFNCTVNVPKDYALCMFDGMVKRFHEIFEILKRVDTISREKSESMTPGCKNLGASKVSENEDRTK
jgi:hypothetical protein